MRIGKHTHQHFKMLGSGYEFYLIILHPPSILIMICCVYVWGEEEGVLSNL